ncbi:universal stress protein [Kitasatospora sp. NPDC101155]|uniref:universal stress protein n=1 Tax=Kitasatospora sp. NPDC101155 TaxID=3364097 RepID=UPI00381AA69D
MSHAVVVGVDGSAQSVAAAEWAAYQAYRSGRALRLIHVGAQPEFSVEAADPAELLPRPVLVLRDQIVEVLPGLTVSCEHVPGSPADALVVAGEREGLLVLGSRGIGGLAGLLLGSVALRAAAHARCPVVLVGTGTDGQGDVHGDVVVGVDSSRPCAELVAFAFERAAEGGAVLRALESREFPTGRYVTAAPVDPAEITSALAAAAQVRLQDTLAPWRKKFPEVRVEAEVTGWPAGKALVEASRSASLVVVGRRIPRGRPAVPGLGAVAHAVLHHSHGPVAVVPHD